MERAADFLGSALRRLKRSEAALAWLSAAWPQIVGRALAARTRPLRCQEGCLEIAADGKAWKKELEELKTYFCARINQAWGGKLVREIKFIASQTPSSAANITAKPAPRRLTREFDNDNTPFIRRMKG